MVANAGVSWQQAAVSKKRKEVPHLSRWGICGIPPFNKLDVLLYLKDLLYL